MANEILNWLKDAVKQWYIPLITGIIFVGVGIWSFTSTEDSFVALSKVFSLAILVVGLLEIYFSIANKDVLDNWGWFLVLGILTTIIGGLLFSKPDISSSTLSLFIGLMLLFRSVVFIGFAYDLKSMGVLEWGTLMVIGVIGVIFAFILLWNPNFAQVAVVVWTGLSFLAVGIFSIYMAFKMRNLHKNWDSIGEELKTEYKNAVEKIREEASRLGY